MLAASFLEGNPLPTLPCGIKIFPDGPSSLPRWAAQPSHGLTTVPVAALKVDGESLQCPRGKR